MYLQDQENCPTGNRVGGKKDGGRGRGEWTGAALPKYQFYLLHLYNDKSTNKALWRLLKRCFAY